MEKPTPEKTEEMRVELRAAAMPLLEFLNRYYCPHAYAVVAWDSVTVVEGNMGVPLPVKG
jgi:hypothetical protein